MASRRLRHIYKKLHAWFKGTKLKRVRKPIHMTERDKHGNICRVCLLGATRLAVRQAILTEDELESVNLDMSNRMGMVDDSLSALRTIKNRRAMLRFFLKGSKGA